MNRAEKIIDIYNKFGSKDYIGEKMTQTEHALQCAYYAKNNNYDKDIIISRDYGEELTYNKTQKIVLGQEYRYMLSIDNQGFVLSDNSYIQAEPSPDGDDCPDPGEFGYGRTKHDWFSGGGTIISDP